MPNPFRFDRLPTAAAFVDREREVARIVQCIREGENLLVFGERRMGKTSCLIRAARLAADEFGATCFFADLSRYSSLAEVTDALLKNAIPALASLGEKATAWLAGQVRGLVLRPAVKASLDTTKTGGGEMELELGLELRGRDPQAHAAALNGVLDALDELAGKRKRKVAVILDEFTFIEKLGPERASWQLRGAMQRHQHLVYILAGSAQHLIDRMHGADGAFFGMFGRLPIGPIPEDEMIAWIDRSSSKNGCKADGVGAECLRLLGPRTRDIVQLARRTFDLGVAAGKANAGTVTAALDSLLEDFDAEFQQQWSQFPPLQQAVLTAVAAGEGATLFTAATRARFGLGSTAEVTQNCQRLTRAGKRTQDFREAVLVRLEHPDKLEHRFDNPLFGYWVTRLSRRMGV
jgi:hypothetical protein